MITPVDPKDIDTVWPTIRGYIEAACDRSYGLEDPDELREKCKRPGHMLLLIDNGAVILQRDANFLHITSLGGRDFFEQMPELVKEWREIAIKVGCVGLSLKGRRGWRRVLYRYGFRPAMNDYLEAPICQ